MDGSTTVPPICKLTRRKANDGSLYWVGVPPKAWMWEKMTNPKRRGQIYGAVKDGHLDAPLLNVCCESNLYIHDEKLKQYWPPDWLDVTNPEPGKRPWTAQDLSSIDITEWVLTWPGADTSVSQCPQTHGGKGIERWKTFKASALSQYARRRNDIKQPHSVSRLSCFLNLGTISIFDIVYELWEIKTFDTTKFQDEIIKWREIGYAHTFAHDSYYCPNILPKWSKEWWLQQQQQIHSTKSVAVSATKQNDYSLTTLANAQTNDRTWNAMQEYLSTTGELHNNARMTWGKTLVHWLLQSNKSLEQAMHYMSYLNDRYALDGISPPSYAGLLWCWGWCDKPGSDGKSLTTKWASKYRTGPDGFVTAKNQLMYGGNTDVSSLSPRLIPSITPYLLPTTCTIEKQKSKKHETGCLKKRKVVDNSHEQANITNASDNNCSILSYFRPSATLNSKSSSKIDHARQIVG